MWPLYHYLSCANQGDKLREIVFTVYLALNGAFSSSAQRRGGGGAGQIKYIASYTFLQAKTRYSWFVMEKARRCPLEVLFRSILYDAVDNVYDVRGCKRQNANSLIRKPLTDLLQSPREHPCQREAGEQAQYQPHSAVPSKRAMIGITAVQTTGHLGCQF